MTPTATNTPFSDFAAIFQQIVGETIFDLNEFTPEEIQSLGLIQADKEEHLLFEVLQSNPPVRESHTNSHSWESLMRKLSQTI